MGTQNLALTLAIWLRATWKTPAAKVVIEVAAAIVIALMVALMMHSGAPVHSDAVGHSWG